MKIQDINQILADFEASFTEYRFVPQMKEGVVIGIKVMPCNGRGYVLQSDKELINWRYGQLSQSLKIDFSDHSLYKSCE